MRRATIFTSVGVAGRQEQIVFVVQVVVAIGIVLATVLVAGGRGDALSPADVGRRRSALPTDRPLESADLADVRLGVGLRGYRMDEVDDLLDRVTIELAGREERIAELERLRSISTASAWTPPMQQKSLSGRHDSAQDSTGHFHGEQATPMSPPDADRLAVDG